VTPDDDRDVDGQVRLRAFQFLEAKTRLHGTSLPWKVLRPFAGQQSEPDGRVATVPRPVLPTTPFQDPPYIARRMQDTDDLHRRAGHAVEDEEAGELRHGPHPDAAQARAVPAEHPDLRHLSDALERLFEGPRVAASDPRSLGSEIRELSWGAQTVRGETYDLAIGEGRRIYEACLLQAGPLAADAWPQPAARYGAPQLVRPRLGQGSFRIAVTDAYGRACAVTTEHSLPTLEAAHIKSYARGGEHAVANGLLLRRDIHRLFDLGYVTVGADDQCFQVSRRLKDEWENGRVYYEMRGRRIVLPGRVEDHPRRELLDWYNREMFLG